MRSKPVLWAYFSRLASVAAVADAISCPRSACDACSSSSCRTISVVSDTTMIAPIVVVRVSSVEPLRGTS